MRASLLLILAIGLAGCTQTIGEGDPLPMAPNFLRLESWLAVSADSLVTEGFVRWVYFGSTARAGRSSS